MKALSLLSFLTLVASPLLAQTRPIDENKKIPEISFQELDRAMNSATKYCEAVDQFSHAQQARLFAGSRSEMAGASKWVEFFSKAEWERAGKPRPIAFAWYRGDRIVRAAITFKDEADNGVAYASYCYSPEGKLVRLQSGPLTQVVCDDAYFQCQLILGVTSFYSATGRLIAKVIQGSDPRALKSERTSFSWVEMMPPLYLTIWDLPLDAVLHKSTKTDIAPLAISPARSRFLC
jgi:hypothetical protein